MTLSRELWQANQDLATACLKSPFVQGLADGSLPNRPTFVYYVGQDAFFLTAFARAYCIAAAKSPDLEGLETFHNLAAGVLSELRLHQSYAESLGIDLQAVQPDGMTQRYVDFLLAIAWSQDVGTTAAAMTPCMRLYAFLGQELARSRIPDHAYADWIRTYSSPEFEQLAQQLEELLDRHATPSLAIDSAYRQAMLCELNFFQAAWDQAKV